MSFARNWNRVVCWYLLTLGTKEQKKRYSSEIGRHVFREKNIAAFNRLLAGEKKLYGRVHDGNLSSLYVGDIPPDWMRLIEAKLENPNTEEHAAKHIEFLKENFGFGKGKK
jgi:hypothetical protein